MVIWLCYKLIDNHFTKQFRVFNNYCIVWTQFTLNVYLDIDWYIIYIAYNSNLLHATVKTCTL